PVLSGVPANKNVEANGPGGSLVNYSTPVANDNLDGLIAAVTCSPDSGSLFPLGTTAVNCSAADSHGNTDQASFNVTVAGATSLPMPQRPAIAAHQTNVKVTPLDGAARIQWNAGGREVVVTRSSSTTRSLSAIGDERVVYTGTASRYTDRGLTNGVEYRYV